jgi:quinoprotein glucose dehydrogenase
MQPNYTRSLLSVIIPSLLAIMILAAAACTRRQADTDYPVYGGNKLNNRFSPLRQIDTSNVARLALAWTYNSADTDGAHKHEHEIQCQPIVIDGSLYGTSSTLELFALDAATGRQRWKFDPFKNKRPRINQSRGVCYWTDGGNDHRLFYAAGSDLWCIDAVTGVPVSAFGDSGKISLYIGLDLNHAVDNLYVTATSPGIVYRDLLILGSAVSESGDAAPGYIRAFDARTGKLIWTFRTIPQPGEPGYETWPKNAYTWAGGVNNWSGLSLDEKRGAVYLGTGSPSSDFYGGDRPGDNLYSDCILSLDAATGKLNWYFQTIHHDLWDRDIPCPPNLTTIKRDGRPVDVVVVTTKDGLVYVLDRNTGTSLFPIGERAVPQAGLPGERPASTQRYPQLPAPLAHQTISDTDLTDLSPEAHRYVQRIFEKTTNAHVAPNKFLPPDTTGTLLVGYSGGAEWGGNAADPDGILYQNSNDAPWLLKMISQADRQKQLAAANAQNANAQNANARNTNAQNGKALYMVNCAACHGANRKGNGHEIPDLTNVSKRLNAADINAILIHGQNRMPSFTQLSDNQRWTTIHYLLGDKETGPSAAGRPGTPGGQQFPYYPEYTAEKWEKLVDSNGYPGIKPPWGTLNAIDLATGAYRWRIPLGEFPELTKKGIPPTGMESYGGPLVTAGGLLFIAGTRDQLLRAFDTRTGRLLWQYHLPNAGFATPITYTVDGRQYVVIAAGGGRGLPTGGYYLAFALPTGEFSPSRREAEKISQKSSY